jgi:hypothetical protein
VTCAELADAFSARRLTEADRPVFFAFCDREPLRLLPSRLNAEASGLDGDGVRFWGVFAREEGALRGVALRFGNTVVAADGDGACGAAFARIVEAEPQIAGVRGTVEALRLLRASLRRYAVVGWEESRFLHLLRPPVCAPQTLAQARRAGPGDLEALTTFYAQAGTMRRSRANIAEKLAHSRVYVVEQPGSEGGSRRIVSCALVNVEGQSAGMIGGVFTLPEARRRGYAGACVAALSVELQQAGKRSCLFYENPSAGRVYGRLGFEEAGQWAILYLTERK